MKPLEAHINMALYLCEGQPIGELFRVVADARDFLNISQTGCQMSFNFVSMNRKALRPSLRFVFHECPLRRVRRRGVGEKRAAVGGAAQTGTFCLATSDNTVFSLGDVNQEVFTQALQNIATLRADNGASMSRLRFSSDNIATTKTNMEAANGRIVDVDIASESTRLAKYNVLVQASASMLAQANTNGDVALMLIR